MGLDVEYVGNSNYRVCELIKNIPDKTKLFEEIDENNFFIDAIDRRILYELSTGTRMKELPNILPLSIAGIEKRKRQLKKIFDVSSLEDKQLIIVAKEKGFI